MNDDSGVNEDCKQSFDVSPNNMSCSQQEANHEHEQHHILMESIVRLSLHLPDSVIESVMGYASQSKHLQNTKRVPFEVVFDNSSSDCGDKEYEAREEEAKEEEEEVKKIIYTDYNFAPENLTIQNTSRKAAVLFVDISGFTKLSTLLDVEALSTAINDYFNIIVNEILGFGGDIIKFAGDAVFAEWPGVSESISSNNDSKQNDGGENNHFLSNPNRRIEESTVLASLCGASILAKGTDYEIEIKDDSMSQYRSSEERVFLNVHCGVGVGNVVGVHVRNNILMEPEGNDSFNREDMQTCCTRKEFFLIGDAITQVTKANDIAQNGELGASTQVIAILSKVGAVPHGWHSQSFREPKILVSRQANTLVNLHNHGMLEDGTGNISWRTRLKEYEKSHCFRNDDALWFRLKDLSISTLSTILHELSLYAHSVVRDTEYEALESKRRLSLLFDGQQSVLFKKPVAELRTVYTMFIMPKICEELSNDGPNENESLYNLLNDIMTVTCRILDTFGGHMRQFIMDDKGIVLIANFGLPGSTFPHLVAERGLPATIAIQGALEAELKVETRIGATLGKVAYCGVIGGKLRHEYSVLGPSINLAARLMANESNPGILVDNAVRLMATDRVTFKNPRFVTAKGYDDPVPIFEPISTVDSRWEKPRNFVGRKREINRLVTSARMCIGSNLMKIVLVSGESGVGKSSMVYQATSKIKQQMPKTKRKYVTVMKSSCYESDRLVPFSPFRSLLCQAMARFVDEESLDGTSLSTENSNPTQFNKIGRRSSVTCSAPLSSHCSESEGTYTIVTQHSSSLNQFQSVCSSLGRTADFASVVGSDIFNLKSINGPINTSKMKSPKENEIVEFLIEIFENCARHQSLTVLAIDDIQWMDPLSWKVIQGLYKKGCKRMMVIAISRPLQDYLLKVDPLFWDELQLEAQNAIPNFYNIVVSAMEREDMRGLISSRLGCSADLIGANFCVDIYEKSGGMPYFACELVDEFKRRGSLMRDERGAIRWSTNEKGVLPLDSSISSIDSLFLRRLDALDGGVTILLQLCAVLGFEFQLSELIRLYISCQSSSLDCEDLHHYIKDSLQAAVEGNVLVEALSGGDNSIKDEDKTIDEGDEDESDEGLPSDEKLCLSVDPISSSDRFYRFTHAIWRNCILDTLLKERKHEIHRAIAISMEAETLKHNSSDYSVMLRILGHWKDSKNTAKASESALQIHHTFDRLGLFRQSLIVLQEVLPLWNAEIVKREEDIVVFCDKSDTTVDDQQNFLEQYGPKDLKLIIQLLIAKGRCLGSVCEGKGQFLAFHNAHFVLRYAVQADDIENRQVSFPIFSALLLLLKIGETPLSSHDECAYEQAVVRDFVIETQRHGSPAHICRALAAKAGVFAKYGMLEQALETKHEMHNIYQGGSYSEEITKAYGSDRAIQCYGLAILWYDILGREKELDIQTEFILNKLVPQIDLTNVHNTFMLLFPLMCSMKRRGMALRAREILVSNVIEKFEEHFGEGKSTFFRSMYKPTEILYGLAGGLWSDTTSETWDGIVQWTLKSETGAFSPHMESATQGIGRDGKGTVAEICFILVKSGRVDDVASSLLLKKGLKLAKESMEKSKGKEISLYSYNQAVEVHKELITLAELRCGHSWQRIIA